VAVAAASAASPQRHVRRLTRDCAGRCDRRSQRRPGQLARAFALGTPDSPRSRRPAGPGHLPTPAQPKPGPTAHPHGARPRCRGLPPHPCVAQTTPGAPHAHSITDSNSCRCHPQSGLCVMCTRCSLFRPSRLALRARRVARLRDSIALVCAEISSHAAERCRRRVPLRADGHCNENSRARAPTASGCFCAAHSSHHAYGTLLFRRRTGRPRSHRSSTLLAGASPRDHKALRVTIGCAAGLRLTIGPATGLRASLCWAWATTSWETTPSVCCLPGGGAPCCRARWTRSSPRAWVWTCSTSSRATTEP
jgi:hypothetical protein